MSPLFPLVLSDKGGFLELKRRLVPIPGEVKWTLGFIVTFAQLSRTVREDDRLASLLELADEILVIIDP